MTDLELRLERNRQAAKRYYHKNKTKCKELHTSWVEKNKEYVKNYQRESKRLRKLKAIQYLGGICKDCGKEFHPAIFEFHHIDSDLKSDRDPSKMLTLKWDTVILELNKCVLLCANCHKLRHHSWEV